MAGWGTMGESRGGTGSDSRFDKEITILVWIGGNRKRS